MTQKPPNPKSVPYDDPQDVFLVRTAKEAIMRSCELLDETKALVEPQPHWPMPHDKGRQPS